MPDSPQAPNEGAFWRTSRAGNLELVRILYPGSTAPVWYGTVYPSGEWLSSGAHGTEKTVAEAQRVVEKMAALSSPTPPPQWQPPAPTAPDSGPAPLPRTEREARQWIRRHWGTLIRDADIDPVAGLGGAAVERHWSSECQRIASRLAGAKPTRRQP